MRISLLCSRVNVLCGQGCQIHVIKGCCLKAVQDRISKLMRKCLAKSFQVRVGVNIMSYTEIASVKKISATKYFQVPQWHETFECYYLYTSCHAVLCAILNTLPVMYNLLIPP